MGQCVVLSCKRPACPPPPAALQGCNGEGFAFAPLALIWVFVSMIWKELGGHHERSRGCSLACRLPELYGV